MEPHIDGLTRYPCLSSPQGILRGLDWVGTVSFAASGCLTAGHMGLDVFGCATIGTITAVGGGSIRDCLMSQRAFWMDEPEYILLCLASCFATIVAWKTLDEQGMIKEDGPLLWWTDTLGIGAFACIGAQNGIRAGLHPLICALCGMFTSTFGGVVRDTLTKRDVRILHSKSEIYACTALSGATAYLTARALGANPLIKIASGVGVSVVSRYGAVTENIKLPGAAWMKDHVNTEQK
jgi:uncharacterized membrane protein YeiH